MTRTITILIMLATYGITANSQCANYQGPDSGSVFINDASIGTYAWQYPDSARSSDNRYSKCPMFGTSLITNYLKATGFGFNIPLNASVCGIMVSIKRKDDYDYDSVNDNEVKLVQNNIIKGLNKAKNTPIWIPTNAISIYGGDADLWGLAWTPADINAVTFGAAISIKEKNATNSTPDIDQILIKVWYHFTTGIKNNTSDLKNNFSIYPNPSTSVITITSAEEIIKEIKVINVFGDIVYQSEIGNQQSTIDLNELAKGIYIVFITDINNNTINHKIILR